MPRTVSDKGDQVTIVRHAVRLIRSQFFQQLANGFHNIEILTLVVTTNIIGFTDFPVVATQYSARA